jgi:hypothetical protein
MCDVYGITTNQAAIIALFRVINRYVGNLSRVAQCFAWRRTPLKNINQSCGEGLLPAMTFHASLDHIIGASKERRRNRQAECLGRGKIDDKLKFGRLLDWNVAGFCPVQNLVHVICRVPE